MQPARGALGATAAAALGALAPQIGAAYERLIRVQKQKAQAGADSGPPPASPAPAAASAPKRAAIGALPLQKRVVKLPAKS